MPIPPATFGNFIRAFGARWFTAMSGPLSVPLAIGAFFVPGYIAKVGLASTAIVCAAFSSYWVWRRERETAIELEERLQRDDRALKKQGAVDGLSEELSWAIQHLLNRNKGKAWTEEMIAPFEADMSEWCEKISKKLENREFFSRSEQLHFDSLGFVKPVQITLSYDHLNWLMGMLNMKFDRLRDVISRAQSK